MGDESDTPSARVRQVFALVDLQASWLAEAKRRGIGTVVGLAALPARSPRRCRPRWAGSSPKAAFAFDPDRFAAHEKFFVEDVRRWAQSRFDVALSADGSAVFGVSASAELALAMGLRHPDIYGAVLCASPGAGYRPPAVKPSPLPRAHLVAGQQEPFFLENATRWADALRDAGADVDREGSNPTPHVSIRTSRVWGLPAKQSSRR